MSRQGVPLVSIQRQLGHADPGLTSAYLRGIDNTEIMSLGQSVEFPRKRKSP
jgi:hypothetical protein